MARIYLDAWGIKGEPSGVGRYCRELIPRLVAQAPQHEFIVLRPSKLARPEPLADVREIVVPRRRSHLGAVLSTPLLAPIFARYGRPDLFHSLFQMLPIGLRTGPLGARRIIVTLHDVIWIDHPDAVGSPGFASQWFRRVARLAILYALRNADHVICNSQTTADRAASWVGPDHRTAVLLGVDDKFLDGGAMPLSGPLANVVRYVAAFGIAKPYKNIRLLVRAFAELGSSYVDARLVLVGGDGGESGLIREMRVEDRVLVVTSPDDAELRSVISHACLFVVPSLVEGFGLPALEAMAAGTSTAIANIPALREVAGDAAVAFEPFDVPTLRHIMERALDGDPHIQAIAKLGPVRAASFRWSRTATETLAVYNKVL